MEGELAQLAAGVDARESLRLNAGAVFSPSLPLLLPTTNFL